MRPRNDNSPPPELKLAITTPTSFVEIEPPDWVVGVKAIRSMPDDDNAQNSMIRIEYGTLCMKYGAISFVKNEGRTSARRTTAFGTSEPTRSTAADRIITYRTLLIRPNYVSIEAFMWIMDNTE